MDRIDEGKLADKSQRPIYLVAGLDRSEGTRVLEFDDDGYPILPISGTGTDGQSLRRVLVDSEGRLYSAPNVVKQVSVTKAVAASGNAETAGDVLSESATAGLATCWTFNALASTQGGAGYISKAVVTTQAESQTARLTLFLFNSPALTCNLLDNVANSAPITADIAKYQGRIDFSALGGTSTTDSNTIATPSTVGNLPMAFVCATGDDALYGILITHDACTTLSAGESVTVVLTVEQF